MAKLYPPYLEGTLPAFSLSTQGNGIISIPFVVNRAVSFSEIVSAKIKIKTVQNDVLLASVAIDECGGHFDSLDSEGNGQLSFNVVNWKLYEDENLFAFKIGQYYKIQLAFIDEQGIEGYYSTVGVIKCTSDPYVEISGFSETEINKNLPEFVGVFRQDKENLGDVTEKVYTSRFDVFYPDGTLAYTSGDILHNIQNNPNSYSSTDKYAFNKDIPDDEIYSIKYTITTTNGLVKSSPLYYIATLRTFDTTIQGDLVATLNYDEGYVELIIRDDTKIEFSNGTYVLSREDSLYPNYWEELTKFSVNNQLVDSMILFRDFSVEQGKTYVYSIQQYNNNGLYTNRKKSNAVFVDFEDIFLYDGERQLKLRFNPQVSNFKTQLAETRAETIGSKYPFFFRNARIGYKIFPISGLLSMLSDNNELFINFDSIMRDVYLYHRHGVKENKDPYKSTDLLSKNILSERLFKMEVLDWLNNGKVKLFKSPSEGNYLVRLMDVSMSPENALGRMLHNISMTAYECDSINRQNFLQYGILKEIPKKDVKAVIPSLKQATLKDIYFAGGHSDNLFRSSMVGASTNCLRFFDLMPGTQIELVFSTNGEFRDPLSITSNSAATIITIGATGNYIADNTRPIYGIYIIDEHNGEDQNIFLGNNPSIAYAGEDLYKNEFNLMEDVHTYIGTTKQIVGESHTDIFSTLARLKGIDISKKEQVFYINKVDIFKRPIQYVYYDGLQYNAPEFSNIWDGLCKDKISTRGDYGYNIRNEDVGANLYLDLETEPKIPFTHKNVLDYEPFGLFVVKNLAINGEKISDHKLHLDYNMHYIYQDQHEYQHMLEKYYIDRILMANTPEEELLSRSLAYMKLQDEPNDEIWEALEEDPLYVIDGWNGGVYKVGSEFVYTPSFTYQNREISLLELESYSLNGLEPEKDSLVTHNGVYANIYYQKTITSYNLEHMATALTSQTETLNNAIKDFNQLTRWEDRVVKRDDYDNIYVNYVKALTAEIDRYFEKD